MEESKKIITEEVEKLIIAAKESLKEVKKFAISEVWRILQLLTAAVIRLIENIGTDLSSPEKKILAMDLISEFYDRVFISIEIPMVPSALEPAFHSYVKKIVMILTDSAIDAMVTTFREIGIFVTKKQIFSANISIASSESPIINNFIKNLKK